MRGLKTNRPLQILTERVKSLSEDELPAIKTAEKFLSSVNKDYRQFHRKNVEIRLRDKKKFMLKKGLERKSKITTV
jgi:hypothetical protein